MIDLKSRPFLEELIKEESQAITKIALILGEAINEGLKTSKAFELYKFQEASSILLDES